MGMKKVIAEMVKKAISIEGSKSDLANKILISEDCLNRKMYQTKGQQFHIDELITIQQTYELTDFTDEICRRTGGVFVPMPKTDELDNVEMSLLQIKEAAARGLLFEALKSALADGEITTPEEQAIRKFLHGHLSTTQTMFESVIALNKRS